MRASRVEVVVLVLILLATIDRPFHRDAEGCGSFYGLLARNYWRYGIRATLAVPVQSMGMHDAPTLYYNHPPLVPMLIAGALGLAGYQDYDTSFPPDWLIRSTTVPFTLGCVVMIYVLLRRHSVRAALLAAASFAAMPMTLIYGGLPDVINPELNFFVLLTVAAYLRFFDRTNWGNLALLSAAFLPAAMTDWPAFYLVVVLGLHFLLTHPVRQWGWIVRFGLIATLIFLSLYVQVVLVTDDWRWMPHLVERRALSNITDSNRSFTWADWLANAVLQHGIRLHTWPVVALSLGWVGWRALARKSIEIDAGVRATGIVLAWAVLHVLVGRQGVLVHEWWWWPLTPAVAMAGGMMLDQILRWIERGGAVSIRATGACVALLVAIFAILNTRAALVELGSPAPVSSNELNYSVDEIGQVIRESAAPNHAVMIAESDQAMSLWYYADRPLRREVWDPKTFDRRLSDDSSDLLFGMHERWTAPPVAFVFPRAYRSDSTNALIEHLAARYPMRDTPKFLVFDLTRAN
jgi:hypothetical protein